MTIDSKEFILKVKKIHGFYTNTEVANHFGVSRARISQWLNSDNIPRRYIDKESPKPIKTSMEKVNPENNISDYKNIISKQINYINLLEEKISQSKMKHLIFVKEIASNWDFDIKILLEFSSLKETLPQEIITHKVELKTLDDYLGYSRENFINHLTNWINSPIFKKEDIELLHLSSEKKRLNALKNDIDSYTISNQIKYYKKDGSYIWGLYRAYYDLNQNTSEVKIKLLFFSLLSFL